MDGLGFFRLYNLNQSSTRFFCGTRCTNFFLWSTTHKKFYILMCLVLCCKQHHITMIYYKRGKLTLFRVWVDVTLLGLNDQLNQINCWLNHIDIRRVDNVQHRLSSTELDGSVCFTQIMFKNDDDVTIPDRQFLD